VLRRTAFALLLLVGCDETPPDPHPPLAAPAGTVARGEAAHLAALAPPGPPVDAALLRRGAERYTIFCAPCHGASGAGDGPAVARGVTRPPPLPADPARSMEAIATNRAGAHPQPERVPPRDRWAIARHIERELAR
jgi:mono/diheme cytochrome c family protein